MTRRKLQKFDGGTLYTGIDSDLKSWKISIYSKEFESQTFTQPPGSSQLRHYLQHHYQGTHYKYIHEAGFSGFSA